MVGQAGFEPTTPSFRTKYADQAALLPVSYRWLPREDSHPELLVNSQAQLLYYHKGMKLDPTKLEGDFGSRTSEPRQFSFQPAALTADSYVGSPIRLRT